MYTIYTIFIMAFITLIGIIGGCENGALTIAQMLEYSLLIVGIAIALSLVIVTFRCAIYMHDKKVRAQAVRDYTHEQF